MGDWKMKIKLFTPIVLVMILFASTLTVAAKPSDLPAQAYRKGLRDNIRAFLYDIFLEIANRFYEKRGSVPQWLINTLNSLGR